MLNSKNNSNQSSRTESLVKTLQDARKAFEKWQDHKTEALIEMEAISYDIQIIEEEKNRAVELADGIKAEMKNQQWAYQNHVETITDQMQLLKFQNEELQGQLQTALDEIHRQQRENESLKDQQKKIEAGHSTVVAQAKSELEIKISEIQHQYRNQVEAMTNKMDHVHAQKAEVENKARKLEQDLQVIRTQMLNALRVGEALAATSGAAVSASVAPTANQPYSPSVITANESPANENTNSRKRASPAFQDAEIERLKNEPRPVFQANSVEEYLKRLGY
jgi:chromosome segregation ATPase